MSTMPVTFQSLRPMLETRNLKETIRFYTETLGFTCDGFSEADGWASLHRGSVDVMISRPNAHRTFEKPTFTGSFYFNVSDVSALWAAVKDNADVCYPMEDFHYGMREFAIYDNNGYLLQFGTPIPGETR